MQLTKTKGTSPSYEIESFASVVTSTDGTPDNDHVLCCKGTDTTVRTTSGSDIPNFLTMKLTNAISMCSSGNAHGGVALGDTVISQTNSGAGCQNDCTIGGSTQNCCSNWGDNTLPQCQSMENQPRIFQARITPMPTYSKVWSLYTLFTD